jgi:hypothetical protein
MDVAEDQALHLGEARQTVEELGAIVEDDRI